MPLEDLEDCGIEELYPPQIRDLKVERAFGPVQPKSVPMAMSQPEYSWEFLETQPYGIAVWESVLLMPACEQVVVFLARESEAKARKLHEIPRVIWRLMSFGMTSSITGNKVMPVVVMILVPDLDTIYEVWFNFYGIEGEYAQEGFKLLGQQKLLYLFLHDRGPTAVRKFAYVNNLATSFRGFYGMMKAMPPWTDEDFMGVKTELMTRYSGEDFWRMR